ncbi:MAG: PhoU domain-containing protein [Candidatus Nitrosocosmicus sp.]|jgi:phosphate uptake regulator|uniref:PhoU domain-containing protein n=1 Tax=Candidatus Nitrosocosmicus agrestis TaxID=2563600 RepID=UPI00122E41F3|nr:phosphate uptake regulator PhoU [Candidatus Nitrosocosmicus sp. SS]KAA2278939.1 phosphate uptake regulator PhoU [Candidatus Nitrosocosmicus sp. SS]KAF0867617.1 phosphate uptake regulator PhoU [Candidatus Nitrosocosmicus sp. SS]MDR4490596.1 phosphate uptake regulator PhoU [Candidatus Nitrosocosmicus sp.]
MTIYTRIVQQIGSSILISLPIEWVKKNSIIKGKSIIIETNIDNTISIYNNYQEEEIKIVFEWDKEPNTINYSNKESDPKENNDKVTKSILNKIFGAYLLGYNRINVHSKVQISYENSEAIKKATRKLIGLEIVDENSFDICFQFLLDAKTLNIGKILAMMNSIIQGMFRETIHSLSGELSNDLAKKIASRDDEIDRQYFLLVRIIRTAIMNKRLASSMNLTNIDMLDYRIAANFLETAGDLIAELVTYLNELKEVKQVAMLIKKIGDSLSEMQYYSVEAFISTSRDKAFKVIENYEDFKNTIAQLKKNITSNHDAQNDETFSIALINSISCLDKIAKCWIDISDLAKPTYILK